MFFSQTGCFVPRLVDRHQVEPPPFRKRLSLTLLLKGPGKSGRGWRRRTNIALYCLLYAAHRTAFLVHREVIESFSRVCPFPFCPLALTYMYMGIDSVWMMRHGFRYRCNFLQKTSIAYEFPEKDPAKPNNFLYFRVLLYILEQFRP